MRANSTDIKTSVYDYLITFCKGEDHAVKGKIIANALESNWRVVAGAIRQLRLEGILIGSNKSSDKKSSKPNGYYLPVTEVEVENYLKTFKGELFDMLHTFNTQKRAKQRYLENIRMGDLFTPKLNLAGQYELALTQAR